MKSPHPTTIVRARKAAQLTQAEAAALLHTTDRVWRQWEAGDYAMHPAFWELFRRKVPTVTRPAVNPAHPLRAAGGAR
jgi:putative transcriptional regulator